MIEILAHAESGSWFPLELPPIHPLLVNFTAALVPVSLLADLAGRLFGRASLRATGYWSLLAAAAITPFTALAGWLWKRQMEGMSMAQMSVHQWLGTGLAVVLIVLACWRVRIERREQKVGAGYFLSVTLLVLALTVQGHLGATMSFPSSEPEESHAMPMPSAPSSESGSAGHDHGAAQPQGMPEMQGMHQGMLGHAKPSTVPSAAEMLEPLLTGSPPPTTSPGSTTQSTTKSKEHSH